MRMAATLVGRVASASSSSRNDASGYGSSVGPCGREVKARAANRMLRLPTLASL